MVAIEEEKCIEIILPEPPLPLIKPIDLRNVGYLQKQPTYICCPACLAETMSTVRQEVVTRWQIFLKIFNICKNSEHRYDINHYCSICGCYIGRYVDIGYSERCISKHARKKATYDALTLKTKPRDCAEHMQKARDRIKENRAKEKAKRTEKETENVKN